MTEWTNSDRVSKPFAKLESGLSISIVESCCRWLLSGYNDELLTSRSPYDILNLVIENRDKMSIFTLMDSYVLKRVFSIVTLSRWVIQILGPDENCMTWGSWEHLDVLSSWTSNIELGSLQCTVEVININKTVIFRFWKYFSVLPCHEVIRRVWRSFIFWGHWTEKASIKFAIVYSSVLLHLTIYLRKRWQLWNYLELGLLEVSSFENLNDVLSYLSSTEFLFFIKINRFWSIFCSVFPFKLHHKFSCLGIPDSEVFLIWFLLLTWNEVCLFWSPL
jgi:hypothetical protein